MQKMIRGTAAFLVLFGLGACYDYPAGVINNGNYHVVKPNPAVGYLAHVGDSLQLLLRYVNDANNGAITSFNIVQPLPSAIQVHYQANFRQVFCGDTLCNQVDKNEQSYEVVGLAAGEYTFKATPTINARDTGSVFIRVAPTSLGALSKNPANFGDTLFFTAPQYSLFSPTSVVSFVANGITTAATVAFRSADSTQIKVVAAHNMMGKFTITLLNVRLPTLANGVTVTGTTTDSLAKVP